MGLSSINSISAANSPQAGVNQGNTLARPQLSAQQKFNEWVKEKKIQAYVGSLASATHKLKEMKDPKSGYHRKSESSSGTNKVGAPSYNSDVKPKAQII